MQSPNREAEAFFHDYDYDACTLNLGLDIMEMLVADDAPSTLEEMAARLSSPVDIVRHVVDFLAARGYLVRSRPDAPHRNVVHLDELRILTPAMRELVRHALPVMRRMSDELGQSCNLSVPAGAHLLVIAQAQPAGPFCINMPAGYTYEIADTAPGLLWSAAAGFVEAANPLLEDVTDLSCLLKGDNGPVAVLTIPYLGTAGAAGMTRCASEMTQAAMAISDALMGSRLVA